MPRQLRSGSKELPASEIDEFSPQDVIYEPVRYIASVSIPVELAIVRSLTRLPGLEGCDLRLLTKLAGTAICIDLHG
ncbi:hypothetical protein PITC_021350 [Penicillium italicum]|uniref:Uncharacterized protein n=1 Tax=Penicillium italicum TaxID=40296 RepID=A0A0A2KDR0_PENIT|nr:hypothetical protein PITC_021350 [Penicillium italicum]